jgi:type VI secretion system secreted protein Hcp
MSEVQYFLKINGIPGESTDARHLGEIEVLSFRCGGENPVLNPSALAVGPGVSKVTFRDFEFTAHTSKASPHLMVACAEARTIDLATLSAVLPGGTERPVLCLELSDVLVTRYEVDAGAGAPPVDGVSLNFSRIVFSTFPQRVVGSETHAEVAAGWDVRDNSRV